MIRSKLPNTATSIFSIMTTLAKKHNAINLSQGYPDFDPHPKLIELVHRYMKEGRNQYPPMQGVQILREAIAEKVNFLYNCSIDPETEITITAGGTQALFTAIIACVNEGDEVVIFEPAYDSYAPSVILAGGVPVFVELKAPDFTIPWSEVKKVINHKTRLIIINSPHNPTATLLSGEDMLQLSEITKNSDILILSDEVYEHMIFDGKKHQSTLMYDDLKERSFTVFSFGKTYHNTGWKIGYCIAPEQLMKEFRKVHQFNVFSVNTPIQYAFADILKDKDLYLELNQFYERKRDLFSMAMENSKFKLIPSRGTYFQLAEFGEISGEGDVAFAERITIEYGVASIPVSVFYHEKLDQKVVRFCFAKEEGTLSMAAEKLSMI